MTIFSQNQGDATAEEMIASGQVRVDQGGILRTLPSLKDILGAVTMCMAALQTDFPHHEAEISQMEAITKEPLANYWLHTGLLTVNSQKMGKIFAT